MNNKSLNKSEYSFYSNKINYDVIEEKGKKKYFVSGYISTDDIDIVDDLVTREAMADMLEQIKSSNIKVDYDHEAFREDPSILPVGKIIEAKLDDKGLWAKVELNQNSPKFKDMWESIKNGFVDAFSIAFKPIKVIEKFIGDVKVRVLEQLKLLNVALTGVPINEGATIQDFGFKSAVVKALKEYNKVDKKSYDKDGHHVHLPEAPEGAHNHPVIEAAINRIWDKIYDLEYSKKDEDATPIIGQKSNKEGNKMSEEEKKEEAKTEEKTEKVEEKKEESKEEAKEEKKVEEKSDSLKKLEEDMKVLMKSNEDLKKELKDLKDQPIFKSQVEDTKTENKSEETPGLLQNIR